MWISKEDYVNPFLLSTERHTYEEVDEVGEIKEVGGAGDTKNLEGIVFFSNAAYAHIALNSIQAS